MNIFIHVQVTLQHIMYLLVSLPSLRTEFRRNLFRTELHLIDIHLGLHPHLSFLLSFSNNGCFKGFVNRSAICSSLRLKWSEIILYTTQEMKSNMCLLLPCNTGFLDNLIVDILSQYITVVPGCF